MFNNIFAKNRSVNKAKWKNVAQPDRPHMTI